MNIEYLYSVMTGMKNFDFSERRHQICEQRWGSMVATVHDSNQGDPLKIFNPTCYGHYLESHMVR